MGAKVGRLALTISRQYAGVLNGAQRQFRKFRCGMSEVQLAVLACRAPPRMHQSRL